MAAPPPPPPPVEPEHDLPSQTQVFSWSLQLWIIVALLVITVALLKFLTSAWFR
jgi:hypothetical protein